MDEEEAKKLVGRLFLKHFPDNPSAEELNAAEKSSFFGNILEIAEASGPLFKTVKSDLILANIQAEKLEKTPPKDDPILAMIAFNNCMLAGVYPPLSVLRWLENAFLNFTWSTNEEGLEELLGLKQKNAGKGNRADKIKDLKYAKDSERITSVMYRLVNDFGMTQTAASKAFCKLAPSLIIEPSMVIKRYKKSTDGISKLDWAYRTYERIARLEGEDMRNFLHQFPEETRHEIKNARREKDKKVKHKPHPS